MKSSISPSKTSGVSHCGAWPASRIVCSAAPQGGHRDRSEIEAVDELLRFAVKHGKRNLEIAGRLALVTGLAEADAGAEIAARMPVRAPLAHRADRALAELSSANARRASPCPLGRLAVWARGRSGNPHAAPALHQRTCLVDRPPQRGRFLDPVAVFARGAAPSLPFRLTFVYCAAQSVG